MREMFMALAVMGFAGAVPSTALAAIACPPLKVDAFRDSNFSGGTGPATASQATATANVLARFNPAQTEMQCYAGAPIVLTSLGVSFNYSTGSVRVGSVSVTTAGGTIIFQNKILGIVTSTRTTSCPPVSLTVKGMGWPTRTVQYPGIISATPISGGFRVACDYVPNGSYLFVTQSRPADVLSLSVGSFMRASDLNASQQAVACSNLCSRQCTQNLPGGLVTGIEACVNPCLSRCNAL